MIDRDKIHRDTGRRSLLDAFRMFAERTGFPYPVVTTDPAITPQDTNSPLPPPNGVHPVDP